MKTDKKKGKAEKQRFVIVEDYGKFFK